MNKRSLLFITLMIFTFHTSIAQESYYPLLQEGKTWHYRYNPAPASLNLQHHFLVQGDTIISDVKYYKILIKMTSDTMGERPYEYYCAIREDNGKVFKVSSGSDKEEMLYDFNMKQGDSISYPEGDQTVELLVKTVGQIKLRNGRTVKCLTLEKRHKTNSTETHIDYDYLIEGIGPDFGFTQPVGKESGMGYSFLSCEVDSELLLTDEDLLAYNNPTEYTDPATQVIYTLDPLTSSAQVKEGVRIEWEWEYEYIPGCPDAKGEITILDKITIGDKEYIVNKIGNCAFCLCDITSVRIPSTVEKIEHEAFYQCSYLADVHLEKGLKEIGYQAFCGCESLSSITLTEGLENIGIRAFQFCKALTSVRIPSSVVTIKSGVFWRAGLISVTSLIKEPFSVQQFCDFNYSQPVLYVPKGTKEKYESTDGWSSFPVITEIDTTDMPASEQRMKPNKVNAPSFDLQGRRLAGKPSKGVYIQDGKKRVMK